VPIITQSDLVKKLRSMNLGVVEFTEWHIRVADRIDIFTGKRGTKWWDMLMDERGKKPIDQVPHFIKQRISERPTEAPKHLFISRLVEIGWSEEEAEQQWKDRQSTAV